jgi:hypothetical protein
MQRSKSYDYQLILATTAVLFIISVICIAGMFYFKAAHIHLLDPAAKWAYTTRMNSIVAPFVVVLILLLGICVPKRLLPTAWLHRFTGVLVLVAAAAALFLTVHAGLLVVLFASLLLQLVVLGMALAGSETLHFEKKNYWVRVGSSLVHLALILFVIDLYFHRHHLLHLVLFWVTTGAMTLGMLFCFYAEQVAALAQGKKKSSAELEDQCRPVGTECESG